MGAGGPAPTRAPREVGAGQPPGRSGLCSPAGSPWPAPPPPPEACGAGRTELCSSHPLLSAPRMLPQAGGEGSALRTACPGGGRVILTEPAPSYPAHPHSPPPFPRPCRPSHRQPLPHSCHLPAYPSPGPPRPQLVVLGPFPLLLWPLSTESLSPLHSLSPHLPHLEAAQQGQPHVRRPGLLISPWAAEICGRECVSCPAPCRPRWGGDGSVQPGQPARAGSRPGPVESYWVGSGRFRADPLPLDTSYPGPRGPFARGEDGYGCCL